MKIITTVGLSLFVNAKKKVTINDKNLNLTYKKEYFNDTVCIEPQLNEYIQREGKKRRAIAKWAKKTGSNASAEIASILKIQEEGKKDTQLDIYLICTETVSSRLAAEYIKEYFEQENKTIYPQIFIQGIKVIESLKIDNQSNYDEGFSNLIEYLSTIKHNENDILNITGGYKVLVPILTLYGQLEKLTLKYFYDDSSLEDAELIKLGQLPIHFDASLGELYGSYLNKDKLKQLIREANNNIEQETSNTILDLLNSMKLLNKDKNALSFLGKLFQKYSCDYTNKIGGNLGYMVELRVYEELIKKKQYKEVQRGNTYYWDVMTPSVYYEEPKYNKDKKFEIPIEIDLALKNKEEEIWCEVKALSPNLVNKAKKQIELRLKFINAISCINIREFRLYFYKIPEIKIIDFDKNIKEIFKLFTNEKIVIKVYYFDLPINNKGLVNWKKLNTINLNFTEYKLK